MREGMRKAWKTGVTQAQRRRTFLLYGIIGASGAILDVIIFALLVNIAHLNPVAATLISTSCGIINNFILNTLFNFKKHDHLVWRFISFYGVGAVGIAASALILLIFSDIFAANPNVVKLLSIPPVVLGQYFLNKHISFSDHVPSWHTIFAWLRTYRYLLLVNLVFVFLTTSLAILTPLQTQKYGAPDEYQHYGMNVDFMIKNHRLPVSGKDDLADLKRCRDNQYGKVPCMYSYQFYPGFNYVVSAITSKAGGAVGVGGYTGARIASVLWGVLFINMLYLLARIFVKQSYALLFVVAIGFIPQVIFTASYVNQDIHSLAIATTLVYSSVAYLHAHKQKVRWLFYLSFGLLFVAKYNYFVTALVPLALLARTWWRDRQLKPVCTQLLWLAGAALLLSGFWYVRNLILYHDPLGQQFILREMSKYHPLGHGWSLFDVRSYELLFRFDFFDTLFKSFFATFGYMLVYIEGVYYAIMKLALVAGSGLLVWQGSKKHRWMLTATAGFVFVCLMQVIANSFIYDFQPQGRYMFVVIPVVALAVVSILGDIDKKRPLLVKGMLFGGAILTLWLVWQSIITIGTVYAAAS